MDIAWSDRLEELARVVLSMSLIGAQDALILLNLLFELPRVQHILRCKPSIDHSSLGECDWVLQLYIEYIQIPRYLITNGFKQQSEEAVLELRE